MAPTLLAAPADTLAGRLRQFFAGGLILAGALQPDGQAGADLCPLGQGERLSTHGQGCLRGRPGSRYRASAVAPSGGNHGDDCAEAATCGCVEA